MIAGLPPVNKGIVLLLATLLLVAGLSAHSDFPHPRLYFTSEDIVQLRALRDAESHEDIWNSIKSWADEHIDDPPPDEPTSWWDASWRISEYIETMGFVYAMTGDTAYAEGVRNWMLAVAEWDEWGSAWLPALTIQPMSFGYDILHDYLSPSELSTIRNAIVNNTEVMVSRYNSVGTSHLNYPNALGTIIGGVGCAALALEDDYDGTATWLSWAINSTDPFLSFGGVDGGWFEGPCYGAFAFNQFIPFLDALKRVKGQNLFDNDFLREHAYYYPYMAYNGGFLQLEDVDWAVSIRGSDPYFIYRLASEYSNGYAQWFGDQYAPKTRMQSYLWKDPDIVATPPTDLPLTKHFRDIGYVIFRTGWETDDLLFAFKSGSSRGHAHPSQNEFGIYYQGVPITCGPGYVCVEPKDDTWSHNCILVDGNGQCQEPGDYQSAPLGTRGEILELDVHDPYYRYVLGDASAVYTGWSGTSTGRTYTVGELDKWLRHVVFVEPNYFVIYDEIAASSPKQFDWLLQAPHMNGEASLSASGNLITLARNGIKLNVIMVEPEEFDYEIISWDYHHGPFKYIKVHPLTDRAQAQFLTVHYPLTTDESMLPTEKVGVGNVIGAKITNGDKLDLILFSKDGNPVDEYIELGGIYKAIDGGDYLFEATGVRVQFDSYQVLRLQGSVDVTPPVISSIAASDITGGFSYHQLVHR